MTRIQRRANGSSNKIWIKKWDQMSDDKNISLIPYIKKLFKHYPKTIDCLKPISFLTTDQVPGLLVNKNEGKKIDMFRKIAQRYHKYFFKHLKLNNNHRNPILSLGTKSLECLSLDISAPRTIPALPARQQVLRKILFENKNIKTLLLAGNGLDSAFINKSLECMKELRSMEMIDLKLLSLKTYQRIFKSNTKIESLSITGVSLPDQDQKYFMKIFDLVFSLTSLKQLRLDVDIAQRFDITCIPFSIFQKKGIYYDLRLNHSSRDINLKPDNAESLKELNVLGLNFKENCDNNDQEWGVYQEESLKAQTASKNILCLNLFAVPKIDLICLLKACRNITVLDLVLPDMSKNYNSFAGLQELSNIRNLFICIENMNKPHRSLFENLTVSMQAHPTLKQLNLYFKGKTSLDDHTKVLLPFFIACAASVEKVILEFSLSKSSKINMDCIYEGLGKCSNLNSLIVYFRQIESIQASINNFLDYHTGQLEKVLASKPLIEELQFLLPQEIQNDMKIDFSKGHNLKKLCVNLIELNVLESCFKLSSLKHLELSLKCYEKGWNTLLAGLLMLSELEVLKLNVEVIDDNQVNRKDAINRVMEEKTNLKLMAVNKENRSEEVLVFTRNGHKEDLYSFYRGPDFNRPRIVMYEVHQCS